MARKTEKYVIQDDGRDKGKVFILTEMSASHAESWATRAILALMSGGVELPEGFERYGMAGIAQLGLKALASLKWQDAQPLLEEMWECVQIMPNPEKPNILRSIIEDDIEEIATRLKLRMEILTLHVGFSLAGSKPTSTVGAVPADGSSTQNTSTSPQ